MGHQRAFGEFGYIKQECWIKYICICMCGYISISLSISIYLPYIYLYIYVSSLNNFSLKMDSIAERGIMNLYLAPRKASLNLLISE